MEVWEAAKRAKPDLPEDLKVHKPYIDAIRTHRLRAGQAHAARERSDRLLVRLGRDAVSPNGAIRTRGATVSPTSFRPTSSARRSIRTRGWFYSQLAISTLLFGGDETQPDPAAPKREYPHPFRNCIVLGLMLGEDGQKMSKQKRNYREPQEIFDRYGADALRWYFFANQAPGRRSATASRRSKRAFPSSCYVSGTSTASS